jgi:choline dehydrogenase-like flavoprotein
VLNSARRLSAPPILGLAEAGFLDSMDALSLPELPASLIVIGAGAIGLELAQLFGRFGIKVTVLEAGPRIASLEEPEIGDCCVFCPTGLAKRGSYGKQSFRFGNTRFWFSGVCGRTSIARTRKNFDDDRRTHDGRYVRQSRLPAVEESH